MSTSPVSLVLRREASAAGAGPFTLVAHRMSRRRLLTASLAASTVAGLPPGLGRATAQTPTLGDGGEFDAFIAELEGMIEQWMADLEIPAVAAGVIAGGKEYSAGFGVTNINHPLPVDADTLFQIGSISKTYTAMIIARLAEEGKIDLDAPVRTYLPEFQVADEAVAAAVTVRQLLNHTSGWVGDVFTETGNGDDAIERYVAEMATNPQSAPLGAHFSYNNAAFVVAGRVIEVVTGQTYDQSMTQYVLEPLGLQRTYLQPEQIMNEVFVSGHTGAMGGFAGEIIVAEPWALPRSVGPAGGIIASIRELMAYARFNLGDGTAESGGRVMSPETLAGMRERTSPGAAAGDIIIDGVGMGWWLRLLDDTLIVQHGGSTTGQEALLVMVPERQFAIGLLTNATLGLMLNSLVSAWALERYLGLTPPVTTPVTLDPAALGDYVGTYGDGSGTTVTIREQDGALVGEASFPGSPPLASDGPLVFFANDVVQFSIFGFPLLADFVRDDTGAVAWFRFSARLLPRLEE